uniref:Tc1-like transposase DDE domain-containing protein n=1 Tax=Amphiprion ocellaris TaxID=80972 RepID=A0AAQ5Z4F7_AMPOC
MPLHRLPLHLPTTSPVPHLVSCQDNDPKHTSRLWKGILTKTESDRILHQMTWPLQSPDLNPIQMVWDEMDRRVKSKQPRGAQGTPSRQLENHSRRLPHKAD